MADQSNSQFSCAACNRQFRWKPALAGRRIKCFCGEPLNVPIDDGLPAFAAPAVAIARGRAIAAQPAITYAASQRTVKNERFNFSKLTDPYRDLYVPLALYLAGFILALLWVATQSRTGSTGLMLMAVLAGSMTAVKTAILICIALVLAPSVGLSFGLFWPAILKFAGIMIFTDTALMWLIVGMKAIGGISRTGQTSIYFIFIPIGLSSSIISLCSFYLFSMDMEEVAMFAVPISILSWFIGFSLNLLLNAALRPIALTPPRPIATISVSSPIVSSSIPLNKPASASIASRNSSPPIFATTAPPTLSPAMAKLIASSMDVSAIRTIRRRGPGLHEGRDWERANPTDTRTTQLIEDMYTAGAYKVYVDVLSEYSPAFKNLKFHTVIVEQPNTDGGRLACQTVENSFLTSNSFPPRPANIPIGHYLLIHLNW